MRESARAAQAWADYLAMGAGRSLERLAEEYQSRTEPVPTRQLSRLKSWSVAFGWQDRLKAIADQQAAEVAEKQAAYRREIMETGLSLDYERVKVLKEFAQRYIVELLFGGKLWTTEQKLLGPQIVDVKKFNALEWNALRDALDDIAKEKGERKTVVDLNVIRREAQRLADELGLDPTEVIAEAERIASGKG